MMETQGFSSQQDLEQTRPMLDVKELSDLLIKYHALRNIVIMLNKQNLNISDILNIIGTKQILNGICFDPNQALFREGVRSTLEIIEKRLSLDTIDLQIGAINKSLAEAKQVDFDGNIQRATTIQEGGIR